MEKRRRRGVCEQDGLWQSRPLTLTQIGSFCFALSSLSLSTPPPFLTRHDRQQKGVELCRGGRLQWHLGVCSLLLKCLFVSLWSLHRGRERNFCFVMSFTTVCRRQKDSERHLMLRLSFSLCVCVCVYERERDWVWLYEYGSEGASVCVNVCVCLCACEWMWVYVLWVCMCVCLYVCMCLCLQKMSLLSDDERWLNDQNFAKRPAVSAGGIWWLLIACFCLGWLTLHSYQPHH